MMNIIENDFLKVTVNNHGAELVGVYDKLRKSERMWSGDSHYWGKVSPVLFPIVGRVKDNYTYINESRYELSQHGFLRDQVFELESLNDQSIVMLYASNGKHRDVYPFEFEVRIEYQLSGSDLHVKWHVKNLSDSEMLYSIGGHPAFAIKQSGSYSFELIGDEPVAEIRLESGHVSTLEETDATNYVDVTYDNFKNDAIIYSNIHTVVLKNNNGTDKVVVSCPGFDFVGLWANTKHGHLPPFVCIEPWLGITDDITSNHQFASKRGMRRLEVGNTETTGYTISFK